MTGSDFPSLLPFLSYPALSLLFWADVPTRQGKEPRQAASSLPRCFCTDTGFNEILIRPVEKEMTTPYSCLDNPVGRGAWWAAVHGAAESDMTAAA